MGRLRYWLTKRRALRAARDLQRRREGLLYGYAWCRCGAPLAKDTIRGWWECSDVMLKPSMSVNLTEHDRPVPLNAMIDPTPFPGIPHRKHPRP